MDLLPEIVNRRSIRAFKKQNVPKDKIERILQAAQLAPSAKNRQEWRFVVIETEELRGKIRQAAFGQEHVGNAPVIIAASPTNIDYRMPNGQLSYPIDIAIATSHMMLQATREGLGSCVVTTFDEQEIRDELSIPYGMRVVLLLLVGYAESVPQATPRKTLKRIASYEHW